MTITQHISIDLQQPGNAPMIHAVQGDEYTRVVEIDLYSGGVAWNPPSGCEVVIRYGKPDGKCGIYGNLPDGTTAWSIDGNTVSVILAPQMLTVSGIVKAQAQLIVGEKQIVSTFEFMVDVAADPSKGAAKSENYNNWRTAFIPQTAGAAVGQYLMIAAVDADGRIVKLVPVDAPAAGGVDGDLDMSGDCIYNAGSVEVGTPAEPTAAWYVTYGIPIEHDDGRVTPVAEFWGSAADDHVLLRFVAAGVDDSDAVNKGQLDTKLPQPAAAAVVGQYLRVAAVDTDGRITAVEAVDAPAAGGGADEVFVKLEDGTVISAEVEFDLSEDNTPALVVVPDTAKVGQTIVVKSVDENGKPTEWEAADLPSGGSGGGENWRLAISLVLEAGVTDIEIDTDDDGNPLNFSEGYIEWYNPVAPSPSEAYMTFTSVDNKATSQLVVGGIGDSSQETYGLWFFKRYGDRLLIEHVNGNDPDVTGYKFTLPSMLDISNIHRIRFRTDGRPAIASGATFKLYVKG